MSLMASIAKRFPHKPNRAGAWRRYESCLGSIASSYKGSVPDFMVISSQADAKWLRENLCRHRGIHMPSDEANYFC